GALHALGARARADEQGDVDTVEGVVWIVVQVEPREQWKRAVDDLHRHALQRAHCGRYLQQPQVDRLVGAEQLPGGDAKYEAVTDLTGGAGDGYAYWLAHLFISFAGNNSIDRRARTRGAGVMPSTPVAGSRRSRRETPGCSATPGRDRRAARDPWSCCRFPQSARTRAPGSRRTR